jgi:hypothetical protein
MKTENDGVLKSLARTVGATAAVIVGKTTQLKDEVVKLGSTAIRPASAKRTAKPSATKKPLRKKAAAKKGTARASAKKKSVKTSRKGK